MLIAWNNLGDGASVTAGSEISTLPGINVQTPHLSQRWHTAAAVKDSYLIFDLGTSQSVGAVFVGGTNLTSTATIRIRSNEIGGTVTSSLEVDTGLISAGVANGYGTIYKTVTPTSSRYWRIDLADAAVASNLQIGRVFLGPYWAAPYSQSYGWGISWVDRSRRVVSRGGQSHLDVRTQVRMVNFSLDWNSEAEMFSNVFALAKAQGIVSDVLVIPDTASSYLSQQAIWGLITESQPMIHERYNVWRQRFTIEERL